MAHFPRWVDSWRVDSVAMYGGYLACRHGATEQEAADLDCLFSIEHTSAWDGVAECVPCPGGSIPCVAEGCTRCLLGKGGYVFRWYDRRWERYYRDHARAGAWKPGEDPDYDPPMAPGADERVAEELNRWLIESQDMLYNV